MNHSIKATLGTVAVLTMLVTPFGLIQSAEADPVDPNPTSTGPVTETVTRLVEIPGPTVTIPGAEVTVTLPGAPVTIRVPGPTIRVPGPTVEVPEIIRLPGPTVTVPALPAETVTETIRAPVRTETVTVSPRNNPPSESVSGPPRPVETQTVTSGGQEPGGDGTLDPEPQSNNTDDDARTRETILTKVVYVTVATIIVGLLGILAMFFGYILGRKDAERNDVGFTRSLVAAARGDHTT